MTADTKCTEMLLTDRCDIVTGVGPVMAFALHNGHQIRPSLEPHLKLSEMDQWREEDPETGVFANLGDHIFRNYVSRFEVDLNRSEDRSVYLTPEMSWGLDVWEDSLPESEVIRSKTLHKQFYDLVSGWIEDALRVHDTVLVLDIHSYNHRRDGPEGPAADIASNPDIDLGMTTLDHARFGDLADRFEAQLRAQPVCGREPDVRRNVRYPDGGHFPEWIFANYGDRVCTITVEYKKIYMDEWTSQLHLPVVEDLRLGLLRATKAARTFL